MSDHIGHPLSLFDAARVRFAVRGFFGNVLQRMACRSRYCVSDASPYAVNVRIGSCGESLACRCDGRRGCSDGRFASVAVRGVSCRNEGDGPVRPEDSIFGRGTETSRKRNLPKGLKDSFMGLMRPAE